MKKNEFMERYHKYQTPSYKDAQRECASVMAQADGFVPVVQAFNFGDGTIIYGLMVQSASDFLDDIGIKTDERS